tara:strand:+ start:291 stop:608 length:318 start_codon:yes stop_codon:yes gene_type:complete
MNFEKLNVDISEENGKISCKVTIPPRSSHFKHRLDITSDSVRRYILDQGHNLTGYVELQSAFVSNKSSAGPLEGTWVFERVKTTPPVPKRKARSKSTLTKKTTKE